MDEIPLGMLLGLLAAILILSAFFSASETSMMSLNRYRLKHKVNQGHRGAKLAASLLAQTDRLLGVILLGNNLLNAAAATLVTIISVRLLGNSELALTLGTLAVTFVILVFSEVTPKIIGAAYAERFAFAASYLLTPLLRLASPAIWFVNLFVQAILRVLRLKPNENENVRLSMDELRTLVLEGGHFIPQKHQTILANLFDLEDIAVKDLMVPRGQLEAIDLRADLDAINEQIATSFHTRIPVYEGDLDNIVGILHVRRLMSMTRMGELSHDLIRHAMRPAYFVPEDTDLFTQLQHFQENQRRIGLVVNEYGELMGLISLEDILEEIVGEFTTNAPTHSALIKRSNDGSWLVDGAALLRDLNRKLGLRLPLDGPRTLNGLILEHLEDIPDAGVAVKIAGQPIEIVQTQDRQVKVARILPPPDRLAGSGGKP